MLGISNYLDNDLAVLAGISIGNNIILTKAIA